MKIDALPMSDFIHIGCTDGKLCCRKCSIRVRIDDSRRAGNLDKFTVPRLYERLEHSLKDVDDTSKVYYKKIIGYEPGVFDSEIGDGVRELV